MEDWAVALVVAGVAAASGVIGALVARAAVLQRTDTQVAFERQKLQTEIERAQEALSTTHATELSVERALQHFLALDKLPYRSFQLIRHHIGGFDDDDLRRQLVRAGAVRFKAADGTEMWALLDRVSEDFKAGRWMLSEAPRNKVPESSLFPDALKSDES